MKEYPNNIKFKYSWRKYQQRVLDELNDHLSDRHLHIIAPPGSGKTILGLEVAIRINKPTLILAPTIAIRNQWIQRFCDQFMQTNLIPDWISRDIRNPKFITVVTYQGLHAACNNVIIVENEIIDEEDTEENEIKKSTYENLDSIVAGLKKENIGTIVVDEAHHLKNEWWQTLSYLKEELDPIIVGLTATPPYDVSVAEWQRYLDLNGPVDAEISVPELVVEGDLCPHQDYIYFSLPSASERSGILDFRNDIQNLYQAIKCDEVIIKAILQHPLWLDPTEQLDWIYTNLSSYSACLIFLNSNGVEIPDEHLEIIGDSDLEIPKLNYEWIEVLLDFYLYREKVHFKSFEEHKKSLENKLKRSGAIDHKKIDFTNNKRVTGFLTSSISKLNGIKEIVDFEYKKLGHELRLVILSDYIRKEFFINGPENNIELNKIGIIPIFEKLRRENDANIKIAVLTGSLIIIPVSAYASFETKSEKFGIKQINTSPVPFDNNYILIHQTEQIKHQIVHLVTQIFEDGDIEVLIGTKSLLGEGWDAPAINALILASFVGSFVLSNQMRGRAIRTQKDNINKTGNIWHLVCVDTTSETGGIDLDILKRRFRSFVGVSFKDEPSIENGIGRLNLTDAVFQKEQVDEKNLEMFSFAGDRENLKKRWGIALEKGTNLVEELKIPWREKDEFAEAKTLYFDKTIRNFIKTLVTGLLVYGLGFLKGLGKATRGMRTMQDLYYILLIFGGLGVILFGRETYKALKLYLKYKDISKDIHQIGEALLFSLVKSGAIRTSVEKLKVYSSVDDWGAIHCHLRGGTTFDKSTFINALQEIIVPINNPRYVIVRKNVFVLILIQRDYHSVPEILGINKSSAEYFQSQWERFVGESELIFTRTIEGRKILLKSRAKSLAAQLDDNVVRVNKWR